MPIYQEGWVTEKKKDKCEMCRPDPDCFSPEDVMEDTEFEIDIKRHIYLVPVAGNILDALREKAKAEGLSTETLINILLQKQTLEGKQEAKRS